MVNKVKKDDNAKLIDIFNRDYSNTTFTSRMYDMFDKDEDAIAFYIKPGRLFWYFDIGKQIFRKIKITYVRAGVMFFRYEDDPSEKEKAWFVRSFNAMMLYAAQIYPYEINNLLSKRHWATNLDFPEICRQCKWDDCEGRITVEVVWNKHKS